MTTKYNAEQVKDIMDVLNQGFNASIQASQSNPAQEISELLIDLSQAPVNPIKVSFPYKTLYVEQATDLNTFISLKPNTPDSNQGTVRLGLLDSISQEFATREAYLTWLPQPNKTILLKFFVSSKISSGRLLLDQSTTTDISVGLYKAPDDGATYVFETRINGNLGSTDDYMNIQGIYPAPDIISNSSGHDMIKVPVGYYAKVFSFTYEVYNAPTFTGLRAYLRNCTNEFSTGSSTIKELGSSVYQKTIGIYPTWIYDTFKIYNNIFDEGTFIEPRITPNAFTVGSVKFTWLLRLYKKVG